MREKEEERRKGGKGAERGKGGGAFFFSPPSLEKAKKKKGGKRGISLSTLGSHVTAEEKAKEKMHQEGAKIRKSMGRGGGS